MGSNDSTAKEQSFLFNVNKIFLVIHLLMLFMFSSLGVDLMAGVNLISICFYFLAFSLTKSEKLSIYVYSVAVEILLHMILAVVCLGIQCNFQLFLIDAMFFLFAMDYKGFKGSFRETGDGNCRRESSAAHPCGA